VGRTQGIGEFGQSSASEKEPRGQLTSEKESRGQLTSEKESREQLLKKLIVDSSDEDYSRSSNENSNDDPRLITVQTRQPLMTINNVPAKNASTGFCKLFN
jgi:hypothetical protein